MVTAAGSQSESQAERTIANIELSRHTVAKRAERSRHTVRGPDVASTL